MIKISIVVPVYNVEMYLERCISSLLQQTCKCLEIILVDDGSTDGSGVLCDQIAEKNSNIKVLHKCNGGLSSARNAGIEVAIGEYVGFVDSDDWIEKDMFQHMLSIAEKYKADVTQVEYVFAESEDVINQIQNKVVVECIEGNVNILKKYLQDGMKEIKSYPVCTKLYRKACFNDIKFPIGQLYEDVVTNYDILARVNKYVVSSYKGYYYFVNPKSITRSIFKNKDIEYSKVGYQIKLRTQENSELKALGEMTHARTYFMCLCKMIKYACDDEVDVEGFIEEAVPVLRKNIGKLVVSKMKWNRKMVLIGLCINTKLTKYIVKVRK